MGFLDFSQDDTGRKGDPSISLTLHSGWHVKNEQKSQRQTARGGSTAARNDTKEMGFFDYANATLENDTLKKIKKLVRIK